MCEGGWLPSPGPQPPKQGCVAGGEGGCAGKGRNTEPTPALVERGSRQMAQPMLGEEGTGVPSSYPPPPDRVGEAWQVKAEEGPGGQ